MSSQSLINEDVNKKRRQELSMKKQQSNKNVKKKHKKNLTIVIYKDFPACRSLWKRFVASDFMTYKTSISEVLYP